MVETHQSVVVLLREGGTVRVDWVGGVRRAVSLSKALWVGALLALPPLTCNAPIQSLEGSPTHITSDKRGFLIIFKQKGVIFEI